MIPFANRFLPVAIVTVSFRLLIPLTVRLLPRLKALDIPPVNVDEPATKKDPPSVVAPVPTVKVDVNGTDTLPLSVVVPATVRTPSAAVDAAA